VPRRNNRPVFPRLFAVLALLSATSLGCSETASDSSPDTSSDTSSVASSAGSLAHCEALLAADGDACHRVAAEQLCGSAPEAPASLALAARELLDCRAVAFDDPSICAFEDEELQPNCVARQTFFHAAREEAPEWRLVMAAGIDEECRPQLGDEVCGPMGVAIQTGDPSACPSMADLRPLCEALSSADPERCGGDADCEELASRLALLIAGGGLPELAAHGTLRDRASAGAAVEGISQCDALLTEPFVSQCDQGESADEP
jgi:hypothetical protein